MIDFSSPSQDRINLLDEKKTTNLASPTVVLLPLRSFPSASNDQILSNCHIQISLAVKDQSISLISPQRLEHAVKID